MRSFDSQWAEARAGGGEDLFTGSPRTQLELLYLHRARQVLGFLEQRFDNRRLRTVEVGCGRGTVSQHLAAAGHQVVLLDASADALALARDNFARHGLAAEYVKGDAEALPFPDGGFDFAFSLGLLEHFDDPERIVAEKLRVVREGGVAWDEVIPRKPSVQSVAAPLEAAQWTAHRLRARVRGVTPRDRHHRTRMSPRAAAALYAGAREVGGFAAVPIPHIPVPDGSLPGRAALAVEKAFLDLRRRRMPDPWSCSYAWGQSFVVYGVK